MRHEAGESRHRASRDRSRLGNIAGYGRKGTRSFRIRYRAKQNVPERAIRGVRQVLRRNFVKKALSLIMLKNQNDHSRRTPAGSSLRGKERPQKSRECRKVSRLDKQFARSVKFRDHTFAAKITSEKAAFCRFSKVVLHMSFPCDEVPGIDDILFAGT